MKERKPIMDSVEKNIVIQDWVYNRCSWKEQTVLFCALRGPDIGGTPALKSWVRFIRRNVLKNAAPNKTFMREENIMDIKAIADTIPLALDMLTVHFLSHLMHALQIIGIRCSDFEEASVAVNAYRSLVEYLHLEPESLENMNNRLKDEI